MALKAIINLSKIYSLCVVLLLLTLLLLFFLRDPFIHKPIEHLLSTYLNEKITIGKIKYSPLYPNVIAFYDLQTESGIVIPELYLEADIYSGLKDNSLRFNEVDIIQPKITKNKLLNFSQLLKNIEIKHLWIKDATITDYGNFSITTSNYNLQNGFLESLHNTKGKMSASNLNYNNNNIKYASIEYSCKEISCDLFYSVNLGSGNIQGNGTLNLQDKSFITKYLEANDLNFNLNSLPNIDGFIFKIPSIKVTNSHITKDNFELNSFSGIILDPFSYINSFEGDFLSLRLAELSLGPGKIKKTHSTTNKDSYNFQIDAEFANGHINTELNINNNVIHFEKINFSDISYDIAQDNFKSYLDAYDIVIDDLNCSNCEFISYISELPLSLKNTNVHISELFVPNQNINNLSVGNIIVSNGTISFKDFTFLDSTFSGSILNNTLHLESISANSFNSTGSLSIYWPLNMNDQYKLIYQSKKTNIQDLNFDLLNQISGEIEVLLEVTGIKNNTNYFDKMNISATIYSKSLTIDNFSFFQFMNKITPPSIDCNKLYTAFNDSLTAIDQFTDFELKINLNANNLQIISSSNALNNKFSTSFIYNTQNKELNGELVSTNSITNDNKEIHIQGNCTIINSTK